MEIQGSHCDLKQAYGLRQERKFELALAEFESLLGGFPENELLQIEIGKTYKMMGKCNEAFQRFAQLARKNPDNKEVARELGETALLSNNCEQAVCELGRVIEASASNEQARIELSRIYYSNHDYEAALKELKSALGIAGNNIQIHINLGRVHRARGNNQEAVLSLKKALELAPDDRDAHVELGEIYRQEKAYDLAVSEIETALKLHPLDVRLRLKLIQLYSLQGKDGLVENQMQETIRISPDEPLFKDSILNDIEIIRRKTVLESKVKRLWVTVTSRCNIRCRTCGLWSSPWDLPRKTADEVIAYYPYLERIVWLGGEVFMYRDFEELFDKALAFPNLQQQIITNGFILTKHWIEKIMKAGVEFTVSVDGVTKEVYEYIRVGSNFERLVENIKLANETRDKYSSKTKMRLNAVIMKSNYHQLEDFVGFAKEHGFCQVSLMALHFDEDPQENILYSRADRKVLEYITEAIPRIRQEAKKYDIDLDILLPTLDEESAKSEAQPAIPAPKSDALYCKMPWKYMFICDKGTVYLTGSCAKPIGNINENSLDEIWNSPQAQLYRSNMLNNEFSEMCRPECRTRWEI